MGVMSLTLSPTTAVGSNAVAGIAKLECKAGPGPITVDLSSSNPAVANPVATSVVVPQGLQSVSFDVTTSLVQSKTAATITGTANGIQKSKTLTVTPAAVVTPTALKFGNVPLNTSSSLSTRLTNKGSTAFAVRSIGLGGPSPQYYWMTHTCRATLSPGAYCDITVQFTPTVAAYRSAYLYLATDATSLPLKVVVSGTGVIQ
jgi:hypothetical protein